MTRNTKNSTLLSLLQNLYSKLALVFIQIRMRSYRLFDQSNKSVDITTVLNKQVGDLVARAVNVKPHSGKTSDNEHQHKLTRKSTQKMKIEGEKIENAGTTESEFVKYLKQRKSSSVSGQPYMGDKLTASVWEHIHSAVRSARQGDVDTAKLHTKIAGQALEEAGHYLNDKDYSELVFQIEHYITDSQKV